MKNTNKKPLNGGFLPIGTRRENGAGIFVAGARGGRSGQARRRVPDHFVGVNKMVGKLASAAYSLPSSE